MKAVALVLLAASLSAESQWTLRHQSALLGRDSANVLLGHEESLRLHGGADAGPWRAEWNGLARVLSLSRDPLLPASLELPGRSRALQVEHRSPGLLSGVETDQLSVRWQGGQAAAVLGRQSVNLGEAFFFSPLDLFAPFAPQEAYRDFRAGVDALRASWSPSAFSLLEAVAVAEPGGPGSLLLRAQANGEAWSTTGLGGRHRNDSFAGVALQLEFWGSSWGFEGGWSTPLALPSHLSADHTFNWNWSHSRQWSPAVSSRLEHRVDWHLLVHNSGGHEFNVPRIQSGLSVQLQASPLWSLVSAVFLDQHGYQAAALQLSAECSLSNDSVLGLRFSAPLRDNHEMNEQWQPYRADLELRTTL